LKIAILSRRPDLYANHRLIAEANARGWHAAVVDPLAGFSEGVSVQFMHEASFRQLRDFDAVIPRYGPIWQRQAHGLLLQLENQGIRSLNSAHAIDLVRNAAACQERMTQNDLPFPKTVLFYDENSGFIKPEILPFDYPMVFKRQYSSQGSGVELITGPAMLADRSSKCFDQHEAFLVQEFIAEANTSDLRLMVMEGKLVAAMRRSAKAGEFRANMHLGAKASALSASVELEQLAVKAASAVGLQMAGVDIIQAKRGPLLLEINACPGFEALEAASGVNVAGKLLDLLVSQK
jgi:ribosomal protein S6--L-glutamate ligase